MSLVEEREQALIESSVYFDVNKGKLVACLPFVSDPKLQLFPNEKIARRVFYHFKCEGRDKYTSFTAPLKAACCYHTKA